MLIDVICINPTIFACKEQNSRENDYFLMSLINCVPKREESNTNSTSQWSVNASKMMENCFACAQRIMHYVDIQSEPHILFDRCIYFGQIFLSDYNGTVYSLAQALESSGYAELRSSSTKQEHTIFFDTIISETMLIELDVLIVDRIAERTNGYIPQVLLLNQSVLDDVSNYLHQMPDIKETPLAHYSHSKPNYYNRPIYLKKFQHTPLGLPIDSLKNSILTVFKQNDIMIITGMTGSGKSTQTPQFIAEYYSLNNMTCRIECIQPRRIAAKSIAMRMAEEMHFDLGKEVGYQISIDSCVSPDTNIIISTW